MKNIERNNPIIIVYALVVVLLLFTVSAYFVTHNKEAYRDTALVGDRVCGNLPTNSAQNACCAKAHEDEFTIQCIGNWEYIEGIGECQFICEEGLPNCPYENRSCGDNFVFRNASIECNFDECLLN